MQKWHKKNYDREIEKLKDKMNYWQSQADTTRALMISSEKAHKEALSKL